MTSPQPPRPGPRAGTPGLDEETMHLPLTKTGAMPKQTGPIQQQPTSPAVQPPRPAPPRNPYPQGPQPGFAGQKFSQAAPPRPAPAPAPPEQWEGTGFRPDIQGLRAVAVMLVLLSHAGFSFLGGGYVGVDVFFVVSGFLITSLLVEEMFKTGHLSLGGFFSRRARRILPAASVVVIATGLGAWLWLPATKLEAAMQDGFTVIVYIVNYRFIAEDNEYLNADQLPSPFQQYWSLAVEEQFYLVWPLLLLCVLLLAGRRPRQAVNIGILVVAAIFAISLVLSVFITEESRSAAYYGAHTRVWELAGGALLALTLPTWKRTPRPVSWFLGIAGLVAICASAVVYTEATPFPGYTALLPVVGTMLVLIAGTGGGSHPVGSLLSTAPFQFVGRISYSLYLWHWPILILMPLALGVETSVLFNTVLIVASFGVAQVSYTLIETPIRTAKPLKKHSVYGIGAGLLCSLLALGTVISVTVNRTEGDADAGGVETIELADDQGLTAKLQAGAETEVLPEDLAPPLDTVADDYPSVFTDGCFLSFEETDTDAECVYGDAESDQTVVLFGDSHAAQWLPAVEALAEEHGWKVVVRSKGSCPVPDVTIPHPTGDGDYTECDQWRSSVVDYVKEAKPAMVIATSSVYYDPSEEDQATAWAAGWERTLDGLGESGTEIVALSDTPRTPLNVPDCLWTNQDSVKECVPAREDSLPNTDFRDAEAVVQSVAGVTVIDVIPWFCLEDVCPVVVENLQIYRDRNHITVSYISSLAPLLAERLPLP